MTTQAEEGKGWCQGKKLRASVPWLVRLIGGCCQEEMFSKCPKTSFVLKISSNNDFTFCPNPGNHRLYRSFSCSISLLCFLIFVFFSLVLDLISYPPVGLVPLPLKLAKSLRRPLEQNQRGEMTAPSAVPLTVLCPCHLASSFTLISSPALLPSSAQRVRLVQGSGGTPCLTARHRRKWSLLCWRRE